MAERAFPRTAFHQGAEVGQLFVGGEEAEFVFGRGTQILPTLGAEIWGACDTRVVTDSVAQWFEFSFRLDHELSGNAGAGWTDAGNYFRLEAQQSLDLVNWSMGKFINAPVPVVALAGGVYEYWSRAVDPIFWRNIIVDLTCTSTRYGKAITDVRIGNATLSLPGYPYAMPADAAALQTDLRANGYPAALVTSTAAALSVKITNHVYQNSWYNQLPLGVTLSGSDVTQVRTNTGAAISLPAYPYAMPAQQAALQADLQTAGQTGAVVVLYGDSWTIFLPDHPAAGLQQRAFEMWFTPGDPHPQWNIFGDASTNPDASAPGTSGNVREGVGLAQLPEANIQFARLKITAGTRYDPYA